MTLELQTNLYLVLFMIIFSKGESDILGAKFGRIALDSSFNDFHLLKNEIISLDYDFLRVRIDNPGSFIQEGLNTVGTSVHLLEILRAYTTKSLQSYDLKVIYGDYNYQKVSHDTLGLFLELVEETYEDIPFGTYTPKVVLDRFSKSNQLQSLVDYFRQNYDGSNSVSEAFLIYNKENEVVGCLTIDSSADETYTYYVGVRKAYRNNDILFKTINFIHHYAQLSGKLYAKGAARLHNIFSQRAFEKSGMNCSGYTWVYLIGAKA